MDTTRNGMLACALKWGVASKLRGCNWSTAMAELTAKEKVLTENFTAFQAELPDLLDRARGKFALLRNQKVVGLFDTASAAHAS